jgi:RHS repeat-associated protein
VTDWWNSVAYRIFTIPSYAPGILPPRDTSGAMLNRIRYFPFGSVRTQELAGGAGSLLTDKLFTGQRRESANGIYDAPCPERRRREARLYDARMGRFLQPDPLVPEPGNPQSLNRYSYVLNNPLRYTDPTGMYPVDGEGERLDIAPLDILPIPPDAWFWTPEDRYFMEGYDWAMHYGKTFCEGGFCPGGNYGAMMMMIPILGNWPSANLTQLMLNPRFSAYAAGTAAAGTAARSAVRLRPDLLPFKPGGKTEGILRTEKGDFALISGRVGPAQSMPPKSPGFDGYTKTHVEGHAAAYMRQHGIKEARLYINNPIICDNCVRNLPSTLPPGSRLELVLPDETIRVFIGNAR